MILEAYPNFNDSMTLWFYISIMCTLIKTSAVLICVHIGYVAIQLWPTDDSTNILVHINACP